MPKLLFLDDIGNVCLTKNRQIREKFPLLTFPEKEGTTMLYASGCKNTEKDHWFRSNYDDNKGQAIFIFWFVRRNEKGILQFPIISCGCVPYQEIQDVGPLFEQQDC